MGDLLNKAILSTRWILAVFYLGLAVALAFYAVKFVLKVWDFGATMLGKDDQASLLALLYLLDSALVAALIVTVALSSWDTLVSRISADGGPGSGIVKADAGNLKIKLATALVAISGINLLQMFMEVGRTEDRVLAWALAIHGTFLLSVVALAVADRLEGTTAGKGKGGDSG